MQNKSKLIMSRMANRCQKGDDEVNFLQRILLFIVISISAFGFRLQGITFNKSLENGYKEYKVYNDSLKKARYKIQILPAGDVDVTKSIEVFPKIITIEPQGEAIFKLFGTGKQKLENREYLFELRFEPIVIPTLVKGKEGEISGSSGIGLTPSVGMKGHAGIIDYSKKLELKEIVFSKDDKGNLIFNGKLYNNSHGSIELGVVFENRNGNGINSETVGIVESNSIKELKILLNNFASEEQIKKIRFYDDEYKTVKEIVRE